MLRAPKDNFRAAVVVDHCAINLNLAPFEMPDISHVLEVVSENDNGEGTGVEVLAKIEKGYTTYAFFDVEDLTCDATGAADVLVCFGDLNTIRGSGSGST